MKRFLILLASFFFIHGSTFATFVATLNLHDLTKLSDAIIKITITDKTSTLDESESHTFVTYYTVTVLDFLKCSPSFQNRLHLNQDEFTFKQIGQGDFVKNGRQVHVDYDVPEYKVGTTYVLFLPAAHPTTGLMAPIGLDQGSFRVLTQNGQESLPEFKARARRLNQNLPNTAQNQALSLQINHVQTEPTYQNFKSMIQAVKDTP